MIYTVPVKLFTLALQKLCIIRMQEWSTGQIFLIIYHPWPTSRILCCTTPALLPVYYVLLITDAGYGSCPSIQAYRPLPILLPIQQPFVRDNPLRLLT